jgi:hypothetical protein
LQAFNRAPVSNGLPVLVFLNFRQRKVPLFAIIVNFLHEFMTRRPVRRGVSKKVEDCCRPSVLRAGHSRDRPKAVSGVAHLQGVEGSGMAGPVKTLGSLWTPLAIRAWYW